ERQPCLGDGHAGRVRAAAEEGHVAESGIAGDPADDVPRGRHDDEHRDERRDPEPQPIRQKWHAGRLGGIERGQRSQQGVSGDDDAQDQENAPPATIGVAPDDHRRRPSRPWGRVTSTSTIRLNAIALAKTEPEPGIDWPNASTSPKASPPTTVALTLPSPPRITTTNACSVYGSPAVGVIAWIIAIRPPATPAHAAPRAYGTADAWRRPLP